VAHVATSDTPAAAKAAAAAAAATQVKQNVQASSALIAATAAALEQMPSPQFTTVSTQITACTAGLSS
jgi:hypothetical protein